MKPSLQTRYLGLELKNPFIVGASPLSDRINTAIALEKAGAAAIVMHSLFEEQIQMELMGTDYHTRIHDDAFPEATSYFPDAYEFSLNPREYIQQIRRLKDNLSIPVIASLNGSSPGGWALYAELIEKAGADALELNFYQAGLQSEETSCSLESLLLKTFQEVRKSTSLPLAVKLSPFYTSIADIVNSLEAAGANGVVFFNRFYQPDIDIELMEAVPRLSLSSSSELLLRLRWLAALRDRVKPSLSCSGGVHTPADAIKALMTGADTVQMVSCLLKNGPQYLEGLLQGVCEWMVQHEYESVEDLRGSMSLLKCPDPSAYERGNYMRILQGWQV